MKKFLMTLLVLAIGTSGAMAATINVPADFGTIEAALAAAVSGDVVTIDNGTYNPVGTLNVDKALTITGASEAGVIINLPTTQTYGFTVTASNVVLEYMTLVANTTNEQYPIHASGTSNSPGGFDNLTIQHLTVTGAHMRTGVDVHGYNTVILSYVTASDATGGNGVQITGCVGVTVDNITTANNAWGSFAIYSSSSAYLNRGSSNVVIDGATMFLGEGNIYNQDEFGLLNTNITVTGYDYIVKNGVDAPGYDWFQATEASAIAWATQGGPGSNNYIMKISDGSLLVAANMLIQPAIDAANPGDTVNVGAGVYREQLSITKDLDLVGAGSALVTIEAPDPIDRTSYTITTWTGSTKTVDPVIGMQGATVNVSGFKVDGRDTGPDGFYGIHGWDCNGSVTGCEVTNITYPTSPGSQNVLNIVYTQSTAVGPFNVDVSNNVLPTMQKGGIAIKGPGYVFAVNNNSVTANPSPSIAGNGIQLSYGASGTTSGNTVTGLGYTGTDWVGTGILLFECGDVTMNGDVVTGSQSAVNYSDWHWVYSSAVPVNLVFNNLTLTGNEWSFGVQLSGDGSDANITMNGCSITGSTGDAVDIWGSGVDPWGGSYYTGWANGNLDVSIDGLTLDNSAVDGIWTADLSGAGTNAVDSFNVTNSSFTNTVGGAIANTFTETINAPGNYWGDVAGPTVGAKALGGTKTMPMIAPWGDNLPEKAVATVVPTASADKAAETVTGPVDFSPWYGFPLGTVPMTVGTNDDIQDGIDLANNGDTVNAVAGTFVAPAQIVIDKNLTLSGAGSALTIIEPGFNTTVGYYLVSDALMYVDYGVTAVIEDLAIDGTGFTVRHGIQSRAADVTVRNCEIRDIFANIYAGRGIVFLTGTGLVENCVMSNIQRIGVHIRGAIEPTAPDVDVDGLTYTGKGVGDFLDYGVEFGGGGTGTVTNSTITACQGVAASDGSDSAGILVTDFYGTGTNAAITSSTLTGNSTGLVVGYDVADISTATIHGCTISGNDTAGVTTTGVTVDALNNWWGTATGPFHGTLNPLGTGNPVSDNVLFNPWSGMGGGSIVPAATGPLNCSQTITLTFSFTADTYTPDVFLYNAVVSATAGLDFGTVVDLEPFGTVNNNFYAMSTGTNQWTITGSTVGNPTSPITGVGTTGLFTITFSATGDVIGAVNFDSLTLRDPDNNTIPVTLTGATITYDCTAPAAVTAITAAPGHNKVNVGWTHDGTDVDHYEVFSGVWHDGSNVSAYPEYDDLAGNTVPTPPASPTAAIASAEWNAVTPNPVVTSTTETWSDHTSRGVYYYTVFAVDAAGNASAAPAALDRATNYWLGDVATTGSNTPDGEVGVWDITALGAAFGTSESGGVPYNNIIDVGPTDDWSRLGIPTTDSMINFEDLMVFSLNFGVVSAAKDKAPLSKAIDLAWVTYDDGSQALRLVNGTGLKGVRVQADLAVGNVEAGQLLDDQSELTFLKNVGQKLDVSVAVMGVNQDFEGSGDLFVVRSESGIKVSDLHITARATDNSELQFTMDEASGTLTPRVFALNANYPNPFNPMTKISFSLPETQDVRLAIYGIDGRKVATLINETRGPGLHEVVWTGRTDDGQTVASGIYFYRIDAGPYSQVNKMTLMK